MELSTVLIVLCVTALVILVAHGLWANRREKTRYFHNAHTFTKEARIRELQENGESSLFTVEETNDCEDSKLSSALSQETLNFDESRDSSVQDSQTIEQAVSQIKISLPNSPKSMNATVEPLSQASFDIGSATIADIENSIDTQKGINSSNVLLREQLANAVNIDSKPVMSSVNTTELKEEDAKAKTEDITLKSVQPQNDVKPTFITLYIVSHEQRDFNGALIAQVLDDLGFIFGEKQIYHRHLDLSINSPILFSVANIEKPGTFEQHNMAEFYTVGLALFMQLPSHGSDLANLRMMIRAAKTIASELGGVILTEQQDIFTEEEEQAYLNRVM
ncbi:cell division protein ZipA [Seminibacterium arietis]|uniref:Cell division protein ZipA n=1 Tax=Seminibacterium arietis TaxID=1173502 RepID=A0ABW3I9H8_9PAST